MANHEDLLNILNAHGQQFLDSFSLPGPSNKKRKLSISEERCEEWDSSQDSDSSNDPELVVAEKDIISDVSSPMPPVVLFSDPSEKARSFSLSDKAHRKNFMSSKVSKLAKNPPQEQQNVEEPGDHEQSNIQNDTVLHRLIHTKLLSGYSDPELGKNPDKRRKALVGHVLELSGKAKLGKGEEVVRTCERNKAAKRIRDGLMQKQKDRARQQLEEAKHLGNYHPAIKKHFESSTPGFTVRKRAGGLKTGVGKFRGGMLTLSRREISMVQDHRQDSGRGRRPRRK